MGFNMNGSILDDVGAPVGVLHFSEHPYSKIVFNVGKKNLLLVVKVILSHSFVDMNIATLSMSQFRQTPL